MHLLRSYYFVSALLGIMCVVVFSVYTNLQVAPSDFPSGKNFTVGENETLKSISVRLEKDHYIASALLFRATISSLGKDRHIKAGGYTFVEPLPLKGIVEKFAVGHPDVPLISLTIPEGSTVVEIAALVHKALPSISIDSFISTVQQNNLEGKLFPSTYFLLPSATLESVIKIMNSTFETKYKLITNGQVAPSPLTKDIDVLSLAAILEGEAKTKEDMQMVAGILLERLQRGMPLQVDAAKDTYATKGLPSKPINNPGEVAIESVLRPTISPYLYYITGKDGSMHYAVTFDEHKRNIQKFLK